MYPIIPTLSRLLSYYDIINLLHRTKEDKLDDDYEDYCVKILCSNELLAKSKNYPLNYKCANSWHKRKTPWFKNVI